MEINTMTTTAPAMTAAPVFAMSGYRSAASAPAASCVRATGVSWIARDRHAVLATDAVAVKGAFPGPDAWSPPTD